MSALVKPSAIGFGISLVVLLIPDPFVLMAAPFGAMFGAWYTAGHYRMRSRDAVAMGFLIGLSWAVLVGVGMIVAKHFFPDFDRGFIVPAPIAGAAIAFVWVTCVATIGAAIGSYFARRDPDPA